jgi:hypothetical protein
MPRRQRRKKSASVLFRSAEWIGWALGGLEREIAETRNRLALLTSEAAKLRARVGSTARRSVAAVSVPLRAGRKAGRKRKPMSAEGRRRISELMKKRWAEAKRKKRNRL